MKLVFTLSLFFFSSFAFSLEVPALKGPIVDKAGILSSSMRSKLGQSLREYKERSGNQVQILTVKELGNDETIETYSIKVADKWQLGDKQKDNGVLFLIAVKDRKMRIEVGQGHEGTLTDATSGRILDLAKPYFKQGNFDTGILLVTSAIVSTIGGELPSVSMQASSQTHRQRDPRGGGIFFLILIIFLIIFGRGRGVSWFLLGALLGRSSRSRGGFGGGSWSGGGGGFSGGGASSGW